MGFNLGAFVGGMASGMAVGQKLGNLYQQKQNRDAVSDEWDKAGAERDSMADAMVSENSRQVPVQEATSTAPAPDDAISMGQRNAGAMAGTATTANIVGEATAGQQSRASTGQQTTSLADGYSVKGKKFDDRESASKYAKTLTPSQMDLFRKNGVDMVVSNMMARGRVDDADAFTKWADDKEGREYFKTWQKTYQAFSNEDYDAAVSGMMKMHGKMQDGYSVIGHDQLKDEKGRFAGLKIKYKNDATGEEGEMTADPSTLMSAGMSGLAPDKMFGTMIELQNKAADRSARMSTEVYRTEAKARNTSMAHQYNLERDRAKSALNIDEDLTRKGLGLSDGKGKGAGGAMRDNVEVMRGLGMSEDDIKATITGRKAPSRSDLVMRAVESIQKNPASISKKPEQIMKEANEIADGILGPQRSSAPAQSMSSQIPARPRAGQIPLY